MNLSNSDFILALPSDKSSITPQEMQIVNTLFTPPPVQEPEKNPEESIEPTKENSTEPTKEVKEVKEIKIEKQSLQNRAIQFLPLVFILVLFYYIPNSIISKRLPEIIGKQEYLVVLLKSVMVVIGVIIFYHVLSLLMTKKDDKPEEKPEEKVT